MKAPCSALRPSEKPRVCEEPFEETSECEIPSKILIICETEMRVFRGREVGQVTLTSSDVTEGHGGGFSVSVSVPCDSETRRLSGASVRLINFTAGLYIRVSRRLYLL